VLSPPFARLDWIGLDRGEPCDGIDTRLQRTPPRGGNRLPQVAGSPIVHHVRDMTVDENALPDALQLTSPQLRGRVSIKSKPLIFSACDLDPG
jgi:hypothetical protein